jgi:hypothetical protein
MKLTSEELRQLYQQHTARSGQRSECLAEELLVRAAASEYAASERARVADHLVSCADCAQEYRKLRALTSWAAQAAGHAEGATAENGTAASREDTRAGWAQTLWGQLAPARAWRPASVAAAVILVAGLSFTVWRAIQNDAPPAENERGDTVKKVRVEPEDGSTLGEVPERLSWARVEPAERYRVSLYDFESTPIWESGLVNTNTVELPQSVRERLPRGKIYWRVITQSGVERRQSDLYEFTLASEAR